MARQSEQPTVSD